MARSTNRTVKPRALLVLVIALLTASVACDTAPRSSNPVPLTESAEGLLSLLDYFAAGEHAAARRLQQEDDAGAKWMAAIERVKSSTVRIRVAFDRSGGSQRVDHGSGVLVGDGRTVLTAGHVVAAARRAPDASEITVLTAGGRALRAELQGSSYDVFGSGASDWGVLRLSESPGNAGLPFEPATAETGSLVVVLGFPGRIGASPSGTLRYDSALRDVPLLPLTIVATIDDAPEPGRLALRPVAGAVPVGGISGGPVVDLRGVLLGIQISVSEIPRRGGVVEHRIDAVEISGVLDQLAAASGIE